jgi:hypothetical protein
MKKLVMAVTAALVLVATSIAQVAVAETLEESFKRSLVKSLTKRHAAEGKKLAQMSCTRAMDEIVVRMADIGEEPGFNAILDNAGTLLAAAKFSNKHAYGHLARAIIKSDEPRFALENFFYLDSADEDCNSYVTLKEFIVYSLK